MKQDLEMIMRRNEEREDERRRDIEYKKRIGQKLRVFIFQKLNLFIHFTPKVLTEIQDKIKDCKTEQKDKSLKYK